MFIKNAHSLGYLSVIATLLCNILLLPIIYNYLNISQIGIWHNYIALYSFILLLDFGLTPTATRELGKYWAIKEQVKDGVIEFSYKLLVFKKIYLLIAIISLIFCLFLAYPYLIYISNIDNKINENEIFSSWFFNVLGIFLSIKYLYVGALSRAVDHIKSFYIAIIYSKIFQLITTSILLFLEFGLIAISIGFLISVLVNIFILKRVESKVINKYSLPKFIELNFINIKDILNKTYKQGIISMSRFLQDKFLIFFVSSFYGLQLTAQIGLFLQIFSIITSFSNIYYKTNQNTIIRIIHKEGVIASKFLFLKSVTIQSLIIILGCIFVYFTWPIFSNFISKEIDILSFNNYVLISCYILFFNYFLVCCNYLLILDDYTMLIPSVVSALIFTVGGFFLLYNFEFDIFFLMIFQLSILLFINGIRWPLRIYKNYWKI